MPHIHPTAVVDSSAILGENVEIGAGAIVEADVQIGDGSIIRPHAVIRRFTTMGTENYVESFAVLGGEPQDYKFDPATISYLKIGDRNKFREGVTVHRATTEGGATTIGNENFMMVNTHVGHDSTVHDRVVFINGSVVAGHCTIHSGAILPANGGIHQFCWVGEKVMFQGGSYTTMHMPPYVICIDINNVVALNKVGIKRDPNISDEDGRQIKEAFKMTYLSNLSPVQALEEMEKCTEWGKPAGLFRDFIRRVTKAEKPFARGLAPRISRLAGRRSFKRTEI